MRSPRRRGFTLADMLVFVFVFGVLLAIIIPMIRSTREAASLSTCQSNSHQIGFAPQQYFNAKGYYPNAATFAEDPAALASGKPADSVIDKALGDGFLPPGPDGRGPLRSWIVDVLPYLDSNSFSDDYNFSRAWNDATPNPSGGPSNAMLTGTDIPVFRCPSDLTAQDTTKGNLSYGCNLGFSRWHAGGSKSPTGWVGRATTGAPGPGPDWGLDVARRTGVMFLGTETHKAPWDILTTSKSFPDGMSQTILLAENHQGGWSSGTPSSGGVPTNWASPNPNFVGFLASDDVCPVGKCRRLAPSRDGSSDGPDWANASRPGGFEAINYGRRFAVAGSFPFANGGHPGLVVVTMCDGSTRTIGETIDGTVYAKLITPAGTKLPPAYRQLPLGTGSY